MALLRLISTKHYALALFNQSGFQNLFTRYRVPTYQQTSEFFVRRNCEVNVECHAV